MTRLLAWGWTFRNYALFHMGQPGDFECDESHADGNSGLVRELHHGWL
jgi:hypothetical protein